MLRAARRARTDYVGTWLPEPLLADSVAGDEALSASLETAFLLTLDRLSARERAAFLLADLFGQPHRHVAAALGISEVASRKLTSRARGKIRRAEPAVKPPPTSDRTILLAFERALVSGDPAELASLLTDDVRWLADGGGRVPAGLGPLSGQAAVLQFAEQASVWWRTYDRAIETAASGDMLVERDGATVIAVLWAERPRDDGHATLYVMRNPDKLGSFATVISAAVGGAGSAFA